MSGQQPGGPLAPFLIDPSSWWHDATEAVWSTIATSWPLLAVTAAAAAVTWQTTRVRAHRARQSRLTAGGTVLAILVPPTVEPTAAEALWSHLVGLLRPWWRRVGKGQPHLAFEYRFTADGLRIRLWAPASVPQILLRRAVEAAWPGAHTRLDSRWWKPCSVGRDRSRRPGGWHWPSAFATTRTRRSGCVRHWPRCVSRPRNSGLGGSRWPCGTCRSRAHDWDAPATG
ncbi:hypothetical protein GCM10010502_73460 [Kitasatospora aureofaciens]|uniref:Type VI secretion protein n=1 Tax=Kitasatospora aureofaciens TaxID=1894 RepID=A0A8H9I077_KITAU|nr:hypothetical protein GCM10010502_73460 [Kitasatospora aureofaciens]